MSSKKYTKKEGESLMSGQVPPPRPLRKLLSYALRVWGLILTLGLCVIGSSLLDLAAPWIIGFLLLDRVIKQHDPSGLPLVIVLLCGVFAGQQILDFCKAVFQELANQRLVNAIRCDLYEHAIALPVRFFDRGRTGDLLSRVTADIDTVDDFLDTLVQDIGSEVVTMVVTLALLFKISTDLTVYLLPTVIALACSVFFFRKAVRKYSRRVRNYLGDLASLAEEAFGGIRVVKAFSAEKFELSRFFARSSELLRGRVKTKTLSSIYGSTVEICVFAGTLVVIIFATPKVLGGVLTVGALVAYLGYVSKLYGPVKKLGKINLSMQKILASADRVFEVMAVPPETVDGFQKEAPVSSLIPPRAPATPALSGGIRFENVSFGYEPDKPVLQNFNLDVKAGEVVALVGPSGGGKTTIVNLLLRFYEPRLGRILIDGVPIKQIPLDRLRSQMGIVSQEPFLFSGTGRENIAYAFPQATDTQVEEAARLANAHDFIAESPQGYGLVVGERGVQLSGGQRQRLAIARVLLRNPRIMIFDEATSHLDSESERLIQESLEKVAGGRTVILIAHRISTIRRADKIVVIEDGGIAEVGRHEELLAREGTYRKLYTLQADVSEGISYRQWLKGTGDEERAK